MYRYIKIRRLVGRRSSSKILFQKMSCFRVRSSSALVKRQGGASVSGANQIGEQSRSVSADVPGTAADDIRSEKQRTDQKKLHRLVPSLLSFQGKLAYKPSLTDFSLYTLSILNSTQLQ